jgi:hypothetical protein
MKASAASRKISTGVIAGAFILFMGFVIYRSLHVAGYRCAVCMRFRGQEVCRTVEGSTEHDARGGATNNACAYLAAGVTDSIACERSEPTKVDCSAIN